MSLLEQGYTANLNEKRARTLYIKKVVMQHKIPVTTDKGYPAFIGSSISTATSLSFQIDGVTKVTMFDMTARLLRRSDATCSTES